MRGSAACTVPAVSAELSRKMKASQAMTSTAARTADDPTPETETTMLANPASVKRSVGAGSQADAPAFASAMRRKVTPHALNPAISQV